MGISFCRNLKPKALQSVEVIARMPDQLMFLPPILNELEAAKPPVRILNDELDKIDIQALMCTYKAGGASNYHPLVALKDIVFAGVSNIYGRRTMERGYTKKYPV